MQVFKVELEPQVRPHVLEQEMGMSDIMSLVVRGNTEKAVYDPVEYLTPEIIRSVGIRDVGIRDEVWSAVP